MIRSRAGSLAIEDHRDASLPGQKPLLYGPRLIFEWLWASEFRGSAHGPMSHTLPELPFFPIQVGPFAGCASLIFHVSPIQATCNGSVEFPLVHSDLIQCRIRIDKANIRHAASAEAPTSWLTANHAFRRAPPAQPRNANTAFSNLAYTEKVSERVHDSTSRRCLRLIHKLC
jgi:hypothetical protein